MALEQAHQAYEDTEDDTNAEIEAQDILNDLESALGLAKSFLSQAPQP